MTIARLPRIALLVVASGAGLLPALTACGGGSAGTGTGATTAAASALAQRAHLAAGRSFTGAYAVSGTVATVRVWVTPAAYRVEVAQGTTTAALYGSATGTVACPEHTGLPTVCYQVAGAGQPVPGAFDAGIERVFTRDLPALATGAPAFAVAEERPPAAVTAATAGARCFTVTRQPGSTALTGPLASLVDVGTYCLSPDGLPVQMRFASGALTLTSRGGPPTAADLAVPTPPQALPAGLPTASAPSAAGTLPKAFG